MKRNDPGHVETDKELAKLEKQISKEYTQAYKDVKQKFEKYMKDFARKDNEKRELVKSGQLSQSEYIEWRKNQLLVGQRWEEMRDSLAKDITNTQRIANSMTKEFLPDAYAINHNYGTFEVEKGSHINTSYTLYDRDTVNRLIRDNPKLLPKPKVDIPKAQLWNTRKLTSAITQGVLQGESIPNIAKRLRTVTDMGKAASIRNARTMTTSAECAGRIDSYKRAEEMGIEMNQAWVATLDDRTRHEHRILDGQIRPVGEPFEVEGQKIMYPGDPEAEPYLVYNCRCTIIALVKGTSLENGIGDYPRVLDPKLGDMSYEEWKHAHEEPQKQEEFKVVNGKDISATWVRRPDKFDFEIEDVINAQGFDGKPRVVSKEEFDKAVKAANGGKGFIAKRTYSAPDQETLNSYRDQLYHGKWYVDCSVNGADRGRGMYCAANYSSDTHGLDEEMRYYINYNKSKNGNPYSFIETFTLTPDAKIANYRDVLEEFHNQKRIYRHNNMSKYFVDEVEKLSVSKEAKDDLIKLLKSQNGISDERLSEWNVMRKHQELNTREFHEVWGALNSDFRRKDFEKQFEKDFKEIDDLGSYCTLKGYDAINAPGERSVDSYTVILNRTKVIILGDK